VLSPELINIIGITLHKGSFPSGHTTTVFTLAGVICLARVSPALTITALTLATLAGLSRVVVGAHWPIDIFGGAFGGWIAAVIGVALFRRLAHSKNWGKQIPGRGGFNAGLLIIALSLFIHDSGYPDSRLFQDAIAVVCLIILVANFRYFIQSRHSAAQ
jgi:H+/Cl- antiporter ClcA